MLLRVAVASVYRVGRTVDSGDSGAGELPISPLGHIPELSLPANLTADIHLRADDPTALASPYLIHIVSPPDARYFPTVAAPATWNLTYVHAVATWAAGMHVRDGELFTAPAEPPSHFSAVIACMRRRGYWQQLWSTTLVLQLELREERSSKGEGGISGAHKVARGPYTAQAVLPQATVAAAEICRDAGHSLTVQV